ncbi:MAG: pectate lyase, partial [Muribaculum sp.]|nr:pectate lyase [Muribaculum sp.]
GWYSNLEVYLNSLVADIMLAGQSDGIEGVDEYYPQSTDADLSDTVVAGIGNVTVANGIVSIEYYSLDGIKLNEPAEGISIRRITYRDGSVTSDKVIK